MICPVTGIATDAAHSMNNKLTQYRSIDLKTGEQIFIRNIGFQTVNIGEFLGIVESIKYILEANYTPSIIYSDSITALSWIRNQKTASKKSNPELLKAEIFLKTFAEDIHKIEFFHWNKKRWGENPADFGNNSK